MSPFLLEATTNVTISILNFASCMKAFRGDRLIVGLHPLDSFSTRKSQLWNEELFSKMISMPPLNGIVSNLFWSVCTFMNPELHRGNSEGSYITGKWWWSVCSCCGEALRRSNALLQTPAMLSSAAKEFLPLAVGWEVVASQNFMPMPLDGSLWDSLWEVGGIFDLKSHGSAAWTSRPLATGNLSHSGLKCRPRSLGHSWKSPQSLRACLLDNRFVAWVAWPSYYCIKSKGWKLSSLKEGAISQLPFVLCGHILSELWKDGILSFQNTV